MLFTLSPISDVDVSQSLDRCRSGIYIGFWVGTGFTADVMGGSTDQKDITISCWSLLRHLTGLYDLPVLCLCDRSALPHLADMKSAALSGLSR